jgi:predicted small lipoprotein YifL
MRRVVTSLMVGMLIAGLSLAGCQKGPMQKAGEKVDEVTGKDKLLGSGPAEKTGRKIDNNVEDIKK